MQRTFSSVLGHPGCFHLLAIVKRTAITTNVACISLGYTARSKGSSSFRFVCLFEEPAYWLPQQLHECGAAPGMREHPDSFQHSAPADTESSASLIQPSHWAPSQWLAFLMISDWSEMGISFFQIAKGHWTLLKYSLGIWVSFMNCVLSSTVHLLMNNFVFFFFKAMSISADTSVNDYVVDVTDFLVFCSNALVYTSLSVPAPDCPHYYGSVDNLDCAL